MRQRPAKMMTQSTHAGLDASLLIIATAAGKLPIKSADGTCTHAPPLPQARGANAAFLRQCCRTHMLGNPCHALLACIGGMCRWRGWAQRRAPHAAHAPARLLEPRSGVAGNARATQTHQPQHGCRCAWLGYACSRPRRCESGTGGQDNRHRSVAM